jgi:hypothetical protein
MIDPLVSDRSLPPLAGRLGDDVGAFFDTVVGP